jgi:hypothetical protein
MRLALAILVATSGCFDFDFGDWGGDWGLGGDWGWDPPAPQLAVYDDGTTLLVTGCPAPGWFGCARPDRAKWQGPPMTATIDGRAIDVPLYGNAADLAEEPYPRHPLRVAVPAPQQRAVTLTFGSSSWTTSLLPGFAVAAPSRLSRSAGPLVIDHEVLEQAAASAIVITTCGDHEQTSGILRSTVAGRLEIDLAPITPGTRQCMHEVRIVQRVVESRAQLEVGAFAGEKNRIEIARVTSVP